jgi:DNA processing protein
MTMFGLKESDVSVLIREVAGERLNRDEILDRFARATWTGLAEPGDRWAGLFVQALGAAPSLDGVVAEWPPDRWIAALQEAGVEDVANDVIKGEIALALKRWKPRVVAPNAVLALRQAARYGARLLTPESESWPLGVSDLGLHSPLALWVRGTEGALAALPTSIALVGARAATGYGEHVAMEAAAGLVDRGFAIVSGAAYGIDGAAHRAALASHGITVAFLAGGVDRFYPSGHDTLLSRIVSDGAVISELPCGQPPTKWRFLQRNRLIAAASQATVVLEAGWRSGSLNTANHAADLGRPVGAVPGPVTSAASAGCHRFIRESKAVLVTNPEEMAALVSDSRQSGAGNAADSTADSAAGGGAAAATDEPRNPEQVRLFDALSVTAPRGSGDIAARAGMSVAEVQSMLGRLELDGRVVERDRGWIKKREATG